MTALIIIAVVGLCAGFGAGLAIARRGFAGWRAEIVDHTESLKLANSVNAKLAAENARLRSLIPSRDSLGRFVRGKGK